jgi:hypothetical protein
VSSDRQKDHTIASQTAALIEYAQKNGYSVPPAHQRIRSSTAANLRDANYIIVPTEAGLNGKMLVVEEDLQEELKSSPDL